MMVDLVWDLPPVDAVCADCGGPLGIPYGTIPIEAADILGAVAVVVVCEPCARLEVDK